MKLHKFEQYINQDILSRGYAYFRENRVNHLKKIGRTYTAQVNGNNIYSVSIETDENSTIHQASCDCPHDAEICKHIVAVMYMITKEAYENTHLIHYQSVLGYLGTLTKDEILNWLKERLVNNLELANQWAIHTSNYSNDSDVVRMAIEFIRQDQIRLDRIKHKNEYQVSYDEIEEATKHFDELIELARTHSNPVTALKLYLMLYETIDEYQTSPSLSDSMELLMDRVKEGIEEIFSKEYSIEIHKTLFDHIERFVHVVLKNNSSENTVIPLLFSIIPFVKSSEQKGMVLHWIDELNLVISRSNFSYYKEQVIQLQNMLISHTESKESHLAFLYAYIQYHEIRKELLVELIKQEDYQKAIEIALEGICKDSGYQNIWEGFLFDIYMKQNNLIEAKRIALGFIDRGYFEYLNRYQSFFSEAEWQVELDSMIEFSKKYHKERLYSQIVYQYHRSKDVIEYILSRPTSISSLIQYVDSVHYPLFEILIKDGISYHLSDANSRKDYRRLRIEIDFYGQLYGKDKAKQIINRIIQDNPRRPALIEELSK